MYVFSVCGHGGLHMGSQTYSSFLIVTLKHYLVTHYHVATHSLQPSPVGQQRKSESKKPKIYGLR